MCLMMSLWTAILMNLRRENLDMEKANFHKFFGVTSFRLQLCPQLFVPRTFRTQKLVHNFPSTKHFVPKTFPKQLYEILQCFMVTVKIYIVGEN